MAAGYLHNEKITREDLSFVAVDLDRDELFFDPNRSVMENVRRFVSEFDAYSIINCTDIFTPEAAQEIARTYNGDNADRP